MSTDSTADRTPSDRVDVCVVGSGIAGSMIAHSLAARGHSVVVLEAGPRLDATDRDDRMEKALRPEHSPSEIWEGGRDEARDRYTQSVPGNVGVRLNRNRLKAVGGTTLHWAAHTPRMHEKDFRMQSRYGLAADWPISYHDLHPYYTRAEAEMGVAGGGDNPFVPREQPPPMPAHPPSKTDVLYGEACADLGIRMHSNPLAINSRGYDGRTNCLGFSTCSPVCPSGAKYTGDIHVRKAEAEGARIVDEVPVQRLEHDPTGSSVTEAVYVTPDGETHRQRARQFVLACGGIETPRLLLLSRSSQYPDGLANTIGLVGRHLHFECKVAVHATLDRPTNDAPIGFLTAVSEEFYDHESPRPGSFRLMFRNQDPQSPLAVALRGQSPLTEPFQGALWGDELLDRIDHASENRKLRIDAQIELLPHEENVVRLDETETDSYGNPVPHVSVDIGPHVVETGRRAIEVIRSIFAEMGATVTEVGDPADQKLQYHHKGTTRMGTDPASSVVDSRLRTHDLNNLWVASSSVFTTGGAVNPTLTIAALALKAADHVDEEL